MSVTRYEINEMIKAKKRELFAYEYEFLQDLIKEVASRRLPRLSALLDFGDMNPELFNVYHPIKIVILHSVYRRKAIERFYKSIHG